jgi:hypothetical protein
MRVARPELKPVFNGKCRDKTVRQRNGDSANPQQMKVIAEEWPDRIRNRQGAKKTLRAEAYLEMSLGFRAPAKTSATVTPQMTA